MDHKNDFPLETLQRWMQAFLVRPIDSDLLGQHGKIALEDIDTLIAPSKRMTARQRLGIYQRGYFARLQECMSKQFSVLQQALGEDLFRDFAYEYLQGYPSESYTLGDLGARFPAFLKSTRPDKDAPPEERESWPDFMIELAQLEWACFKLMECDGSENGKTILQSKNGPIAFHLPPALQLFALQFPSYPYYKSVLHGQTQTEFPAPASNLLLLVNRNDRIGAFSLTEQQYSFWQALEQGQSIDDILAKNKTILPKHWLNWKVQWEEWGLLIA